MHIESCAGRRVALLNRAASIDRCVFCGMPTLLIFSFPVASSLTCCMHQQMHMFAFLAGRFALDRALLKACAQFVWLLVCLSCLAKLYACLRDQACWFTLSPLDHHLAMCCIHTCISFELRVQIPPRRQIFSHALVLNKLRCCGLLFEMASTVASLSCVRVDFPCHEREALFSSEVCLWTLFLHSSPFLSTFRSARSALPVSIDTKFGRDKLLCFPCARLIPSWPAKAWSCMQLCHMHGQAALVARGGGRCCLVCRWVRPGPVAKPAAECKAARATAPTTRPAPGQQPNCGWYWHFAMSVLGYLLFIGRVYKHDAYIYEMRTGTRHEKRTGTRQRGPACLKT